MTGFLNEAHVNSVTGQAAYSLARSTGQFCDDAHQRLSRAVTGFEDGRARAVALRAVPGLHSARITRDLLSVREAASRYSETDTSGLRDEITAAITVLP